MAKVRKFSEKTFTCAKCGKEFTALRKHELCPVCNAEKRKAYQKSYVRKENRGKPVVAKPEVKKPEAVKKSEKKVDKKKQEKKTPKPCKFCGKLTTNGDFCTACVKEGFDNVYNFTGRSNGWDKKFTKAKIEFGWRGRACCGFGTLAGRNSGNY